jgi:hypothetical protein
MQERIINITEAKLQHYLDRIRPPMDIRNKLDIGYHYDGKNIEFFEIRPRWDNPQKTMKLPYAKITYVKSRHIWKLYWMRASGKWESYSPLPNSTHLEELFECIDEDRLGCFKG